ncbi:MAG: hypothetical protein CW338_10065 [Clostridiales bacterium]|nr:hypothetical protein [Clostridiales bacterium]
MIISYNDAAKSTIPTVSPRYGHLKGRPMLKKRIFSLLTLLAVLFSLLPFAGIAENRSCLMDNAGFFSADEREYFEERLELWDVYTPDFVIITDRDTKGTSLKDMCRTYYEAGGFSEDTLLLLITDSGSFWLYAKGGAGDVISSSVISELKSNGLFPAFFSCGDWADGLDSWFDETEPYFEHYSEEMECTPGGISITSAGNGKDRITVSVRLTNYAGSDLKIANCLSGILTLDGRTYTGKLNFKYKSVYSMETLDGTVTFDVPRRSEWTEDDLDIVIGCRERRVPLDGLTVKDDRPAGERTAPTEAPKSSVPEKNGSYTSKEDVAAYIRAYGKLPPNFITKSQAEALGWVSSRGNLWDVAPGKSIGGDRFGNYDGLLPRGNYTECDIDYDGGYRSEKRLVFCKDGNTWRIYYTPNHYESFEEIN